MYVSLYYLVSICISEENTLVIDIIRPPVHSHIHPLRWTYLSNAGEEYVKFEELGGVS